MKILQGIPFQEKYFFPEHTQVPWQGGQGVGFSGQIVVRKLVPFKRTKWTLGEEPDPQ